MWIKLSRITHFLPLKKILLSMPITLVEWRGLTRQLDTRLQLDHIIPKRAVNPFCPHLCYPGMLITLQKRSQTLAIIQPGQIDEAQNRLLHAQVLNRAVWAPISNGGSQKQPLINQTMKLYLRLYRRERPLPPDRTTSLGHHRIILQNKIIVSRTATSQRTEQPSPQVLARVQNSNHLKAIDQIATLSSFPTTFSSPRHLF
jgi:hypothetical protein